jgi:hypothetical protein
MIGFKTKKKRFNMFYLEENELYTRDLQVVCVYRDINTNEERFNYYF